MKKLKSSNPVRLIAFFLTAVLLICTFGLGVEGSQKNNECQDGSDNTIVDNSQNDSSQDISKEDSSDNTDNEPEIYIPEFINRLTGVESSEEIATSAHLAFVMNPDISLYGISGADIVCDIPTEIGRRIVAFIPESQQLWKIGAISPTRGYISNLSKFFGGICISAGNDDEMSYGCCDVKNTTLDLTIEDKYYYTEFTDYIYTNRDMLSTAIEDCNIITSSSSVGTLPYAFNGYDSPPLIYGNKSIFKASLNDSNNSFSLIYDESKCSYSVFNKGELLKDTMNGKGLDFTNCLILFADSVVYDNSRYSQMVMDTVGSGSGFYLSLSGLCEIKWSSNEDGMMKIMTLNGEDLTINRGKTYLSFLTASTKEKILFE